MHRRRRFSSAFGAFVFAAAVAVLVPASCLVLFGSLGAPMAVPRATASVTPSVPPEISFDPPAGATQSGRWWDARFASSRPLDSVSFAIAPDPGLPCAAVLESASKGRLSCDGLLAGSTSYVATLSFAEGSATFATVYAFRTMGDRLEGVRWFTEFENPAGDPLACAAASCRIVQLYATGRDPMTAEQILAFGRQFDRSRDPGLDPAAIAEVLHRLDSRNTYHYYVFATREQATRASIAWLLRSGKPVIAITLAGQHAPLVIGYAGTPDRPTGVVILDPQRGDLDARTASRRPDKYRSAEFQTGALIGLDEWYRDEWWLGFAYAGTIKMPDGSFLNIDRNDGAYAAPHWAGKFVILVDDGDGENAADREGRISLAPWAPTQR